MPSELLSERQGAVLILTISAPETRNPLSEAVVTAGIEALSTAESDDEIRCVVLRGAGAHFCAGGNVQGLMARRQSGPPAQARMLELLHQWVEALRACPKPVIAAVEGAAAGAGFSLSLACDMIVASEEARFILSYAKLGLSPDGGATWQLMRALPRHAVQQMVWLAEPVHFAGGEKKWQEIGASICISKKGAVIQGLCESCFMGEKVDLKVKLKISQK